MLSMGYMPSDFHPQLLVLGQHAELARFAELLEGFSADGRTRRLTEEGVESDGTEVTLTAEGARRGLWPEPGGLVWTLTPDDAARFAGQVDRLAASPSPAGSEVLDCAVLGEVRVQVSVGEWEDDVLDL